MASYTCFFPLVLLMVLRTVSNFFFFLLLSMRRLSRAESFRLKSMMYGLSRCKHAQGWSLCLPTMSSRQYLLRLEQCSEEHGWLGVGMSKSPHRTWHAQTTLEFNKYAKTKVASLLLRMHVYYTATGGKTSGPCPRRGGPVQLPYAPCKGKKASHLRMAALPEKMHLWLWRSAPVRQIGLWSLAIWSHSYAESHFRPNVYYIYIT